MNSKSILIRALHEWYFGKPSLDEWNGIPWLRSQMLETVGLPLASVVKRTDAHVSKPIRYLTLPSPLVAWRLFGFIVVIFTF